MSETRGRLQRLSTVDGADLAELEARRDGYLDQLEDEDLNDGQWDAISQRLAELHDQDLPDGFKLRMECAYLAWAVRYPHRVGPDGEQTLNACYCGSRRGGGMIIRDRTADSDDPFDAGTPEAEPCGRCNPIADRLHHTWDKRTRRSHLHCDRHDNCTDCEATIEQARNQQRIPV